MNDRFSTDDAQLPYDRTRLTAGMLHIEVGSIHRAHLAAYMNNLFTMGEASDWAILGAVVRPEAAKCAPR